MKIKKKIKNLLVNLIDLYDIKKHKSWEMIKIKDPRRVSIYSKYKLTNEQKKQIDDLYIKNYGKKIPYYWHQYYSMYTGNFDASYFPELLFIPEFERYENYYKEYATALKDKNLLPFIASSIGVKIPKTLLSCTYGIYRDKENNVITKEKALELLNKYDNVFIKPSVDSDSGDGCFVKNGNIKDISELGNNFIVQEKITNSESLKKLNETSINTIRIKTYRWKDKIETLPTILRTGRNGNVVDNIHHDGLFIYVDKNGVLGDIAFTEFNDKYYKHPDTEVVFKNYKITNYNKLISTAIKLHYCLPQLGMIHWDLTLDNNEDPVLIEANVDGGNVWASQMSSGRSIFGEKTAEVLQWLKLMNKTNVNERYKYVFGNMNDNNNN